VSAPTAAPDHCQACGHPPADGDPLVLADGVWVHESHTQDERSGFYGALAAPATTADCCAAHQDVDPAELAAIHPGNVHGARQIPVCVVCLERQLAQGRATADRLRNELPPTGPGDLPKLLARLRDGDR
jgi:hypothetical protein